MKRFPFSRAVLAGLTLLAAASTGARAEAHAQLRSISNVATLEWESGRQRFTRSSNRVDIALETPPAAAPTTASTFRIDTAGSTIAPLASTRCGAGAASMPITWGPAYTSVSLNGVGLVQTGKYRVGEPLIILFEHAPGNRDPQVADALEIVLRTSLGDLETLTLVETGPDTGRFAGAVPTVKGSSPVSGDCKVTVRAGETLSLGLHLGSAPSPIATATVSYLIDPFGIVFDSGTGAPVSGVRVSLVDAVTGRPAPVFGDDGVSAYPSSVVTGQSVTDSGGTRYDYPPGDYRFPLMPPGRYRIVVEPPQPYTAPSNRQPAELAGFRRPDGPAFTLLDASYGAAFTLSSPEPVRIDIPIDAPALAMLVTKTASRAVVEPGDVVQYRITIRNRDRARPSGTVTLTDRFPAGFRLRAGSGRLGGKPMDLPSSDGRGFTASLPSLAAGADAEFSYLLEVLASARAGDALNRAQAVAGGVASPVADAVVRVSRETISARMTITGRITDGGCVVDPARARGIGGVRVMLEDGSYAVTDVDGRYHFEGVLPGIHVVQLDESTLPADRAAVECARNTRSAGRAWSRFVEGSGGAHKRVDFRAGPAPARAAAAASAPRPAVASDAAAAGAEIDMALARPGEAAFLFPMDDYNPRARVTRVAISHSPGHSVSLRVDGKPADKMTFDGTSKSADGRVAVSRWRGIALENASTRIEARVVDANGAVAATLARTIAFSGGVVHARIVPAHSVLTADGVTRPVIAVRLTDRDGRPVRHGTVGEFTLPAPYLPAVEVDAQTARQLGGLERAQPFWRVDGDDGLAFIALEATTASGTVAIDFAFRDGNVRRESRVEVWLDAGARPWTVVGFAAGTVGFNSLKRGLESLGAHDSKLEADGKIALYAKGRVRGRWLLTLAYDSDKREAESRFAGTIDPQAYYTIYADRSERRYDTNSLRKLYLKLERPQFYALFGDYDTGLTQTELTRYARAFNGLKAEYRGPRFSATAFAADTPFTHRRDEIQGNGLTGPYGLSARDILANSEIVSIETRDRFRSNIVVETRRLTRHIDYDIDYLAGKLRFREPVLSRSSGLDPHIIVADYEIDGVAGRSVNAGGRVAYDNAARTFHVGAAAVRDKDERGATTLAGSDVKFRPSPGSEIRAEAAVSERDGRASTAWLVEGELHTGRADLLAYAREQESGFGVGQTNAAEDGSRKFGVDARFRVTDRLSLSASGWREDYLDRDASRTAGRALLEYRGGPIDLRAGVTFADDRLADGRDARSTLVQLGAGKRLFGNRLELDASTEFALGGRDESIDYPARHKLAARFAIAPDIHLIAAYEIAEGDAIDARTLRVGFDLEPWAGARFALTGNRQAITEYGPRSFAAYGLSQSLVVGKSWTVDLTVDGNRTLGGIDPSRVLNPAHPVASGGFIGDGSLLTEDFTAVTAGATYRAARWSANARAEYRAGDRGDRYGVTAAALRQVGEGSAFGGAFNWNVADLDGGARTRTAGLALSWAHRPADSRFSWLEKLELRDDRVGDAIAGQPGLIDGASLLITGDARSRRVVNSLSLNWSPTVDTGSGWRDRAEVSLFWGARYASERFGLDDVEGLSNLVGADIRFNLSDKLDIGTAASVRHDLGARAVSYSFGPNVGVTPFENGWLSVGYNLVGFRDRDFEEARYTRAGPYVMMRFKFDQLTLQRLVGDAR